MSDTQYGFVREIGKRNKLGTGIVKTKEGKCHLTNINADYKGNFPILDLVGMINNAPSSLLEKLSCQSHKKAIWSIRQDFTI